MPENLHGNIHASQVNKISPPGHGSRSSLPAQIGSCAISFTEAIAFSRTARHCVLGGREQQNQSTLVWSLANWRVSPSRSSDKQSRGKCTSSCTRLLQCSRWMEGCRFTGSSPSNGNCYPPLSRLGAKGGGSEVPGSQEKLMIVLDLEDVSSGDVDAVKCASLQQLILSKRRCVFACKACLTACVQVKPCICVLVDKLQQVCV